MFRTTLKIVGVPFALAFLFICYASITSKPTAPLVGPVTVTATVPRSEAPPMSDKRAAEIADSLARGERPALTAQEQRNLQDRID
jgi:hypothetical protein